MLDIILILIHNLSEIPFCILLVVGMICEKSAHLADLILSTNFQLILVVLVLCRLLKYLSAFHPLPKQLETYSPHSLPYLVSTLPDTGAGTPLVFTSGFSPVIEDIMLFICCTFMPSSSHLPVELFSFIDPSVFFIIIHQTR